MAAFSRMASKGQMFFVIALALCLITSATAESIYEDDLLVARDDIYDDAYLEARDDIYDDAYLEARDDDDGMYSYLARRVNSRPVSPLSNTQFSRPASPVSPLSSTSRKNTPPPGPKKQSSGGLHRSNAVKVKNGKKIGSKRSVYARVNSRPVSPLSNTQFSRPASPVSPLSSTSRKNTPPPSPKKQSSGGLHRSNAVKVKNGKKVGSKRSLYARVNSRPVSPLSNTHFSRPASPVSPMSSTSRKNTPPPSPKKQSSGGLHRSNAVKVKNGKKVGSK